MRTAKVIRYQTYLWFGNKPLSRGVCVFLLLLLALIVAYAFVYPVHIPALSPTEQEEEVARYRELRERYRLVCAYLQGEGELPEGMVLAPSEDYQRRYDYYDYLLQTHTFEDDYRAVTRARNVCERTLSILSVLLPLASILLVHYLLTIDIRQGREKNLAAAPIARTVLLRGKVLAAWCGVAALTMVFLLCPMISALCDNTPFLVYRVGVYQARSSFSVLFLPSAIGMGIGAFFWSGVTLLCTRIRHRYQSLVIPLVLYATTQIIYYILQTVADIGVRWRIYSDVLAFLRYATPHELSDRFGGSGWAALSVAAAVTIAICAAGFVFYSKDKTRPEEA